MGVLAGRLRGLGFFVRLFVCFLMLKEGKQTPKASLDQNPAVEVGKG